MAERGRPTDYRPEYAGQAAKFCALGASDYELADFFKVDTRTIYRWKIAEADVEMAMQYAKLAGRASIFSPIAIGCMGFGDPSRGYPPWSLDEEASRGLVRHALEAGIKAARLEAPYTPRLDHQGVSDPAMLRRAAEAATGHSISHLPVRELSKGP